MSETDTQSAPRKTPAKSSSAKGGASRGKPIKKRGRKIKYQTALQAVFKTIAKEKAMEDLQVSAEAMQIWDAAIVDLMKRMIAKAFKYAQQTGKSTLQATHAKAASQAILSNDLREYAIKSAEEALSKFHNN